MNYLKRILRSLLLWANTGEPRINTLGNIRKGLDGPLESSRSLTFNVHTAHGGKIVQFTSYNNKTDEYRNDLYIIVDGDDLGVELGHIITRISLSH